MRVVSLLVLAVACGADPVTDDAVDDTEPAADTDAPQVVEVTAASFGCITDLEPVRRYRVGNLLGDVAASLAVAEDPAGKRFPPGTLLQLVPFEAMVKRETGFAPETGDWEFFFLEASAGGTTIVSRGADAENPFGDNCASCHAVTADTRDWTCEQGHGCVDLPFDAETIATIQAADPRCAD